MFGYCCLFWWKFQGKSRFIRPIWVESLVDTPYCTPFVPLHTHMRAFELTHCYLLYIRVPRNCGVFVFGFRIVSDVDFLSSSMSQRTTTTNNLSTDVFGPWTFNGIYRYTHQVSRRILDGIGYLTKRYAYLCVCLCVGCTKRIIQQNTEWKYKRNKKCY